MPRKLLNKTDLHVINHALGWTPPEGVDAGLAIQREPACVVVVMECLGEKIAVNLFEWNHDSRGWLDDTAIALKAVAAECEKARQARRTLRTPVIDTSLMNVG